MKNKEGILSNLRESKADLDSMINEIEKDNDFDFEGYYSDIQHIYHHLNTAWNIRKEKEEAIKKCIEEDFNRWRHFPSEFDMDKMAEKTLQHGEQKLKAVVYGSPIPQFVIDQHHKVIYWNKALEEASGIKAEEVVGTKQHWRAFYSEERPCLADLMVDGTIEKIPEWYGEKYSKSKLVTEAYEVTDFFPALGKTGRWLYFSAVAIRDLKGETIGAIEVLEDITEQKRAEGSLRDSREELRDNYFAQSAINMILSGSLIDRPLQEILQKTLNLTLSIPWLSFEAVGNIYILEDEPDVLVMKAQYNLPQQLKESCAHLNFGECLCGKAALTQRIEFADRIDERHDICCEGMAPHGQYAVPLLFGRKTLGVINIYVQEGHSRSQKDEEFLLAIADTLAGIIVRRKAEDEKEKLHTQLLQSQKMEAVGHLAGGIAHDFNNILSAMIGYGHLLKMKLKEEDPLAGYADHILSLSDKAANLTKSLLAFSRKQIINPRPVDLNEIIRRIDHLLSRIIGEDIQLKTMLSEGALTVMADPGQMEQVLMNLATNARDAMPGGGLLTIQTETVAVDHEFIKSHGFGKGGPYVLLSLTDTGIGMDRETTENIFEPFFTTKELGKGTGLGLAMVYGIIKQHEGNIDVYSEPGKGTTFRIHLPLIEAEAEEIKPEVIQPVEKGTETVLLAEDETEVREFTKHLLEENDYRVITAADGEDAINKFKVYKNEIQFVLLDVIMPNKNGKEVYDEIKQIRPGIKVLFLSGYPADIIHKHGIIEKGFAYIEKPVSPTKLLKKIREVLSE